MTWQLTPEERRTLAVVLALLAAGYAVVGWRAWWKPEPAVDFSLADSLFAARGRELALDTLQADARSSTRSRAKPAKPKLVVRWPLDLNRADSLHLLELPGIGPSKVGAMLAFRRRQGFAQVEDLLKVGGIGPATLEKLRPKVMVKGLRPGAATSGGPSASSKD